MRVAVGRRPWVGSPLRQPTNKDLIPIWCSVLSEQVVVWVPPEFPPILGFRILTLNFVVYLVRTLPKVPQLGDRHPLYFPDGAARVPPL